MQSQINVRESKGFVQATQCLSLLIATSEGPPRPPPAGAGKMFDVGLYISLYADNEEDNHAEAAIKSMLESRLIYIRPALFQQEEAFQSIIPVNEDKIAVTKKSTRSHFRFFLCVFRPRRIRESFTASTATTLAGAFDRFSLENYNSVTFAKSGSGKSSYQTRNTSLFDVRYRRDCHRPRARIRINGRSGRGRYFNISLNSEHHINPFDLPIPREDESPPMFFAQTSLPLLAFSALCSLVLTPEEDAIIDRAIAETYALKDITPD